jgi:integrase/recombinase XerD
MSYSSRLENVLKQIEFVENEANKDLINQFSKYLLTKDASANYQRNCIKIMLMFAEFLQREKGINMTQIVSSDDIILFLDSRRRRREEDPDQKWITTWNDYLWRIKIFYRWYYNTKILKYNIFDIQKWKNPDFVNIPKKKTKRLSPYSETEIWEKDELQFIIKYESNKRNKAILALLWDLNARNHELTLLRIKNIRIKEKYGEGEVPYEAKTGSGPILLTLSFPYVRDWLNEHPFRNEANARLICNIENGKPLLPGMVYDTMYLLKKRIMRLVASEEIKDAKEKEKLLYLLKTKKWNPYCIRHSSITSDSDYLPEYALKKKVRWSMNSRQGSRYIKNRMGNDLKEKILEQNGIILDISKVKRSTVIDCPRCTLINQLENKFCSKCSYPLKPEAYEELKEKEENEMKRMKQQINEMNNKFNQMISMIQQNPILAKIKPEVLTKKINDPVK